MHIIQQGNEGFWYCNQYKKDELNYNTLNELGNCTVYVSAEHRLLANFEGYLLLMKK